MRSSSRTISLGPPRCGLCVSDLRFCDVHDAYFCPNCDRVDRERLR
jgi:rubredoxin